jgi:CheY-like chemotaxis protein
LEPTAAKGAFPWRSFRPAAHLYRRISRPFRSQNIMSTRGPPAGRLCILVVDDNRNIRDIMSKVLWFMGYHAVHAGTATEAMEIASSEKPDVILLDIRLPDMDGRDLARQLRAHPATNDIAIIAFTGMGEAWMGPSCIEAGCDDYVVKPVPFEVLREKLRSVLDGDGSGD